MAGRRSSLSKARSDSCAGSVDEEGSRAGSSKTAAFLTEASIDELPPGPPATCIEDVVIDYEALIHGPQPPPNCKTEVVLNHVSDGILEDWKAPNTLAKTLHSAQRTVGGWLPG